MIEIRHINGNFLFIGEEDTAKDELRENGVDVKNLSVIERKTIFYESVDFNGYIESITVA